MSYIGPFYIDCLIGPFYLVSHWSSQPPPQLRMKQSADDAGRDAAEMQMRLQTEKNETEKKSQSQSSDSSGGDTATLPPPHKVRCLCVYA